MLSQISTLIFDLDGTLGDPRTGIHRCINHAMEYYGYPPVAEECVVALIGPPLDEIFRRLLPEADQSTLIDLVSRYRERYAEMGYAESRLYPGIPEALQALSESGLRLGVCTSKRSDFAEQILTLFKLRSLFAFVSGGDVGIAKSTQLSELLSDGEIDHQAIMIGDRYIDIESARANGLRSIGVLWGFGDYQELLMAGADVILDKPADLKRLTR
ncbi:MAG: HAD-IA family hydrolase [Gammaproteobacteria bacterium]|nr:HAD-IA family hydrolase [Pseudomonadales bacterium]MCP5348662.1 HAD-IA family hydrolase [Pseudomonadales bacterium]